MKVIAWAMILTLRQAGIITPLPEEIIMPA
jgi:hypothetical protein